MLGSSRRISAHGGDDLGPRLCINLQAHPGQCATARTNSQLSSVLYGCSDEREEVMVKMACTSAATSLPRDAGCTRAAGRGYSKLEALS